MYMIQDLKMRFQNGRHAGNSGVIGFKREGVQFHSVEGKEHNLFSQDLTNGFSMETRNQPWIHHSDDGFNPLKFT